MAKKLLPVFLLVTACARFSSAQVNVTTYHNDNGRTGQNLQETILTTSNVNATNFGKLFSQSVDGYSYGQPLYLSDITINGSTHNVVYVATMNDSVYAFDADSNSGTDAAAGVTTVPTSNLHCSDPITTQVGIFSTPVIDTEKNTIFVVAHTLESGVYYFRLHALNLQTGAEQSGSPVVITATVAGTGSGSKKGEITFNAQLENQRAALLLQNGLVYVSFGSLCDYSSYHGWLFAYGESPLKQSAVWLDTPDGSRGAIWQAGDGPAGDDLYNTYVSVANGTFDVQNGGIDYGESVVKLGPPANGAFPILDYFTPYNYSYYDSEDLDLGSSGLVLLPTQTGTYSNLVVQSDKAGDIFMLNGDDMGHFNSGNNNQIVQYLPAAVAGMWSSPAWWNNYVYIGAETDDIEAYSFNPGLELLSTMPSSQTGEKFGYPGTTVSISSDGTSDGIVWALNNSTYKNSGGQASLHAYKATDLATSLYSSKTKSSRDDPGAAIKFTVPTIANGKVYITTQKNLVVYGLLN